MMTHDRSTHRLPWSAAGWTVLGVAALAALALALVLAEGLGPTLVVTGFASLVVLRLAAMRGRWTSLASASIERREPANEATRDGGDLRSRRATPQRPPRPRGSPSPQAAAFVSATSDLVDTASSDSFPASDPPSWTGARVGAPRRLTSEAPRLP